MQFFFTFNLCNLYCVFRLGFMYYCKLVAFGVRMCLPFKVFLCYVLYVLIVMVVGVDIRARDIKRINSTLGNGFS